MIKKDATLFDELAHRAIKKTNRLYFSIYKLLMLDFVSHKYHMHIKKIDDISKEQGPAIIVFNHLSRIDHAYVLAASWPRQFNMMAGYNEFFRSHLAQVFKMNNCIPKKNYYPDVQSIKTTAKILKEGGVVSLAPEGLASNDGGNKPVVPGTGKMLKHFKVPVYFVHMEGEYLQNTKVNLEERYGETYATISKIFTPDDLEHLTSDDIDNKLNELFRHDEYAWNKEHHIKWQTYGHICEHLEDLLYKCPKCGQEFTLKGTGNQFQCSCGNGATMDDYYTWHPFNKDCVIPKSPKAWNDWQRQELIKDIRQDKDYSFTEEVEIGNLDPYQLIKDQKTSNIVGQGKMIINHQGFYYQGTRHNEPYSFTLPWSDLYSAITVKDASYFSFYVKGEYYDFFPKTHSVGKILLLIEEMHRYHINFYKNFSWYDYMYEGLECGIDLKK